ncbi:MAG TPA: orotidine-5'-phosphate decarboxylase [Chromatiales bacterium]|nr:orotidine-5'-phosphate decarboxylase [Chromatiales bacterium]
MSTSRIIVALDFDSAQQALDFVHPLQPGMCRLKVGKELFTLAGPDLVRELCGRGFDVFLDLKFHDIPHTVARACKAAAALGVWMLNVHALGGRTMLQAARDALESVTQRPMLIAVTILTSMAREDLQEIGLSGDPEENVLRLAALARQAGLDGVVCSSREVTALRTSLSRDFRLVTPGIRPAGSETGDQKRIMTPGEAIQAGSDYLVIGRPITRAGDPVRVLARLNAELAGLGDETM